MNKISTEPPFKADIIGSFLRTDNLLRYRRRYEKGNVEYKSLRKIEQEEIVKLVEKQLGYGLKSVTDGEYTRKWTHLDFFWEIEGLEKIKTDQGYPFHSHETPKESVSLCGKLNFYKHSIIDDFEFLNKIVKKRALPKVCIPAPSMLLFELLRPGSKNSITKHYTSLDFLITDIAKCAQKCIQMLYNAGCRHIQMDNNVWGLLLDENMKYFYKNIGYNVEKLIDVTSKLNILSFSKKPKDMCISMHVCRGNYRSDWAFSGSYEPVADAMFNNPHITGFYLEYDSDRAGGFEPLRFVREKQIICLGLVSTKTPTLEDPISLKTKIFEASQYVDIERLALSTQCGFASTVDGNNLTKAEQWAKISLVVNTAKDIWKK